MKRLSVSLVLCLLTALTQACETVSFSKQVLPVLMRECAYCHMREDRHGYLVVEGTQSWANLVGVPAFQLPEMSRVQAGRPQQSYLWLKLTGQHIQAGGRGWRMPFHPLRNEDMNLIFQWIEQGAADN